MRFRFVALAACLALATGAGKAAAQDRTGTFEISPFAGGYFGGRLYGSTVVTTTPGTTTTLEFLEPDDDLTYGVRLAYNVTRHFAFEFDWTSARTDLRTPNLFGVSPRNLRVGRLRQNVYEANMLFNFGRQRAIGYFGLGAGAATLDRTDATFDAATRTRFTANISAGAKFFFTPRVGLRLDARYRAINQRSDSDRRSCDRDGFCSDRWNRWSYNGELTGGLVFAF
ncbi:MAG: outer membrane beta-barrel protein [Thermoanaerobaculia bacterium]|jgi:Outer membrane protein beta-barrel domain